MKRKRKDIIHISNIFLPRETYCEPEIKENLIETSSQITVYEKYIEIGHLSIT